MIELGKTLREAREARNYSVSQLAEATHILPQIIEDLENEDFSKIVAPIYGRGFVKLYCEAVGLEPKPFVAEFMEIFNGNRQPTIRIREVETENTVNAAKEEVPFAPEEAERGVEEERRAEPEPREPEIIASEPPPIIEPFENPPVRAEPFKPTPDDLPFRDESALAAPPPTTPRRDYRLPGYSMPEVPRRFWRFGLLALVGIAILALLAFGTRALYRATMTPPSGGVRITEAESGQPDVPKREKTEDRKVSKDKKTVRVPRKGVEVPPLYID